MKRLRQLFTPIAMAALIAAGVSSCTKDRGLDAPDGGKPSNLMLTVGSGPSSKGGGPGRTEPLPADVAAGLRLFAFSDEATPKFSHYLPVSNVTGNVVSSNAPVGDWELAMTYFRNRTSNDILISPVSGVPMDQAMLYHFTNNESGTGNSYISASAPEIFRTQQKVSILANQNTTANAVIARNVAMVQLVISKSTLGIDKNAAPGSHKVYLHNVPSTISYGGQLLKSLGGGNYEVNADNPDVLAAPLEGRFALSDHTEAGYLKSDTVNFIIPAHQGSDFYARDGDGKIIGIGAGNDMTTLKMSVSVDLERPGGSRYEKMAEIPVVAQANKILRVSITVNAGIEIGTAVLPWNYVAIDENVGQQTTGAWVYVKQGASGTGLSWGDAVGTINEGIAKAQTLKAAGSTIHGVLIAGGAARNYAESINVTSGTAGIRIYGGWEGTPGTELAETDNADYPRQPQTSTARKLSTHKAVISGSVELNNWVTYMDGFKVKGNSGSTPALGINNAVANVLVANAVEITGNTTSNLIAASTTAATYLTNILIADNAGASLSLGNSFIRVVNSTIAGNAGVSLTDGTFTNTAVWGNTGTVNFTGSTMSASASNVAGTTITLNAANTGNLAPLFNLSSQPKYAITGANSPLSISGNSSDWTTATTGITAAYGISKDIEGNPRTTATSMVDIGAYQSSFVAGYHPLSGTPVDWHSTADWGYVGTFHRADETKERLIVGPHASGDWSAYVENGADWISLDQSAAGTNGGVVLPGNSVAGAAPNATTASGAQGIHFRVGLRTPLWGGATANPRYGTIIVTWHDGATRKQSRIYVRQGEMEDYVFTGRSGAMRFSPYNLSAATFGTLPVGGGKFAQYPSQCGGYFQWMNEVNPRIAYAPSGAAGTWDNATPYYEAYWTENEMGAAQVVAANHETCPAGYRRVNDGATNDEPTGISEMRQSLWASPAAASATNTYGGYYADGFFDQNTITTATHSAGTGDNIAYRGRLFYNPATNASLFFPAAGHRKSADGAIENAGAKGYYWSSSSTTSTTTPTGSKAYMTADARSAAVTIRCVKQ